MVIMVITVKCFLAHDEPGSCSTSLVSPEQPVLCMIPKHHPGATHDPQPQAMPHLMCGGLCMAHTMLQYTTLEHKSCMNLSSNSRQNLKPMSWYEQQDMLQNVA